MRLKKIIKQIVFEEDNRSKITLGTDVRLNPLTNRLQLKEDAVTGLYPLTADLYGKTWVTNPQNIRGWLIFQAFVEHAYDEDGLPLTSVGFRLSDGTDQYWWDGGAWVVNTTSWNTEVEVAGNIADFPVTSRQLQIIVNLVTTDSTVTPQVEELRLLYNSDIEFEEDLVIRSMVPLLREGIRPISDFPIILDVDTTTIDMKNEYMLETPYNVVDIDAVFNHTDDPEHWIDLYQSFDVGTQVITLTASQTAGKQLWIKFIYEPEVAVTTGQEYSEIDKVPSIILTDIGLANTARVGQDTSVLNKATGEGVKLKGPHQTDIDITLRGHTDSSRDQKRLADELRKFFINNVIMVSRGLDEEYRLWLTSEYAFRTTANQSEIHSGLLRFRIVGALFYQERDEVVYAVQSLNVGGDLDVTIN